MMAITPPPAPQAIAQRALLEADTARDLKRPAGVSRTLMEIGGGEPVEAAASDPLPIYSISIEALAADRPSRVDEAVQHGWRVRTADAEGEQIVDLAKEGTPVAVRRGMSTEILVRAASLAEKLADPTIDYEARLLDFGQLGLSALWLHRVEGSDRFFALDRKPRERDEHELIAEAERRARDFLRQPVRTRDHDEFDDFGG